MLEELLGVLHDLHARPGLPSGPTWTHNGGVKTSQNPIKILENMKVVGK